MLGCRVVTLHPAVHGGILARRDVPGDLADLAERDRPIDLVGSTSTRSRRSPRATA
jgi:phosphoribosylaminoimidazolecarboxamide formyltransferase/IMP cyclohydrolase